MDVPEGVEGGLSVPENSVAEPVEPVSEESQATSMARSCATSCADRDTSVEVEVEPSVDEEQRVDVERHVKATAGVDVQRTPSRAEANKRVDVERPISCAEADEAGERAPSGHVCEA